ncbi:MAG: M28 family metallopeptidase [Fimbriimonadales bacterium]
MKLLPVCLFSAAAALGHAQYAGTAPIPEEYRRGTDAIKREDAKGFLMYLSGPECEGRGTVQPGFQKAAQFVAARFKEYGLKPVGNNGTYFQIVHFARATLRPADSMLESANGSKKYAGEGEIAFGSLSKNTDVSSETVWIRFPKENAHVPANAKLKGKIVVVTSRLGNTLRNELIALQPLAIVAVMDEVFQAGGSVQRPTAQNLTRVSITRTVAAKIAKDMGIPATLTEAAAADPVTTQVLPGKGKLRLIAKFDETDPVDAMNVVGYREGSDPTLRKELIGIGAHLDHLGKRGDVVYPGADDDGSGSTAVIEIAKAFHEGSVKPKRSILFMTFCGEEMGLLGSGFYSDNPIFPHENMIAELQMDMVGRDSDGVQNNDPARIDKKEENIDTIRLVGSKRISTDLDNLIEADNKYIGFKFKWDAEDVYTRSDHYNFAKHGIPIAFLFDGFHPDYHQPTDTVDKIDWDKLMNAAKLYYIVAIDLANHTQRPRHDVPQTGGGG